MHFLYHSFISLTSMKNGKQVKLICEPGSLYWIAQIDTSFDTFRLLISRTTTDTEYVPLLCGVNDDCLPLSSE